ncbi:MAG: MoxR family ATPase [Chloroflexota bacterium]
MENVAQIQSLAQTLRDNVAKVIVGKEDVVNLLLTALLCEGHVLLEDVPGIGKTMLAKTMAQSIGGTFQRIQFTPDLLPSDITGVSIFNQQSNEFEFRSGPIMAQIALADEINRAGPRTQSALLEAMEERQVTVDGVTRPLPYPFLVMATQNPVEQEGTFPLPEAQLDRFLIKVGMGYPDREEERQILRRFRAENPLTTIQPVVSTDEIRTANQICRQVYVHPVVEDYILDLVTASRNNTELALGVSPRGTMALYRTVQAWAAIQGRHYVIPDDVKVMAVPVWAHRLVPDLESRLRERVNQAILADIVDKTPVPVEENWEARANT